MSKLVILCVDDEAIVLMSLKEQLKRHFSGKMFSIEIADGPVEALEVLDELENESDKIVVVISDWLMPVMKGDEFLHLVHLRRPKTVKVMLTGQADEKAIDQARKNANLFDCIYKPWNVDELLSTIEKALVVFSKA